MNLSVKKREGSPDFVLGSFGCKYDTLKPFVNKNGWVNFDILKGKENGYYIKVSDYGLDQSLDAELPF